MWTENKEVQGLLADVKLKLLSAELQIVGDALSAACRFSEKLEAQKDSAYAERNKLVALISKIFPSCLGRHEDEDLSWEDDWRWIVYVNLPTGQCSWHIHDSDLPLFSHLEQQDVKWDGHTTEEKYRRVLSYNS